MEGHASRSDGPRRPSFRFRILGLPVLAGCSLGQPIARRAIDDDGTVEQAANSLPVRNIRRARDATPLHFTTVPQIRGPGST